MTNSQGGGEVNVGPGGGGGGGYGPTGTVNQASRQVQQKPRKRFINLGWSEQFAGEPLSLETLDITVGGGRNKVSMKPNGKRGVAGETITITVTAQPLGQKWLYNQATFQIAIIPNVVRLFFRNLKAQWLMTDLVTPGSLGVAATLDGAPFDLSRVTLRLVEPAGGRFAAAGDAVPVRVEMIAGNYFVHEAPLIGSVKVVKQTPSAIAAQVRTPLGIGTTIADAIAAGTVVATIEPNTLQNALMFTPAKTTVLDTPGDQILQVSFPGDDHYNPLAAAPVTFKVMAKPVITWPVMPPVVYDTILDDKILKATTTPSGLEPALTFNPPRNARLQTIGTVQVTARFAGSPAQPAAEPATVDLAVIKDTPTIVWPRALPVLLNAPLTLRTLCATARGTHGRPVSVPLVFAPALNTAASPAGDLTLKASFAGNGNFNPAADQSITVKVIADAKELGREAMASGPAMMPPTRQRDKDLLDKWNTDDSPTGIKAQSKQVMAAIQGMTADEMIAHMDDFLANANSGLPPTAQLGTKSFSRGNWIWELPNGLQVRLKPLGDGRPPITVPPTPMFCVEGKTCTGPSQSDAQVAWKVSSSGEPAAYGPRQTLVPDGIGARGTQSNTDYIDGTIEKTHLKCTPKVEQTITWANPPDITVGETLETTLATVVAQDKAALDFFDGGDAPVTKDTVLALGDAQTLKVKGKLTNRYLASANFVEVTINVVRKTQSITWNPVATEIFAGNPVGGDFLNATAGSGAAPTYAYSGGAVVTGDTLPAGSHEVTASAGETPTHLAAAPEKRTITVKLNPQTITWEPKMTEIFAGNAVGGDVLNATAGAAVTPTYAYSGGALTAADKLPVGPHEVTATAAETATHAAASKTVTITVKLNPQTITWEPKVTEIFAGNAVGGDFLNATAGAGVTPTYAYSGGALTAADKLPAGPHEVTARAGETALYAEAQSKTATINVKLNPQTITWEPKVTEIPVGTLLGDDFLNASAAPGVTPVYEYQGAPFDAANPLPAGTHEITATAGITALYAAADPVKKSVTVLAKAEETK